VTTVTSLNVRLRDNPPPYAAAHYLHMFTLYWSVRPFGASMLLACKDFDGYALYLLEPSGECQRYFGGAVQVCVCGTTKVFCYQI
jgi:20S proteasome alpha/beta subunit